MASIITNPPKQLAELLQQQQEPFVLDVYLVERGYARKKTSLNSNRDGSFGFWCKKASIPSCSKILITIFNKFGRNKNDHQSCKTRTSCSDHDRTEEKFRVDEMQRINGQEVAAEPDRFSSASSTTVYNSCSETDKDDESPTLHEGSYEPLRFIHNNTIREEEEAFSGEVYQGDEQFMGNIIKQHNPILVFEETNPLCQDELKFTRTRQDHQDNYQTRSSATNDPTKLIVKRPKPSPQFLKSKRMLQQTRQLLFDCVREIVESHARKEKGKQNYDKLLGPGELGKLLLEKMKAWGNQAGDHHETNNADYNLFDLDSFDSAQEWNIGFETEKMEISSEIGDAIGEEMVSEVVIEFGNYFESLASTNNQVGLNVD